MARPDVGDIARAVEDERDCGADRVQPQIRGQRLRIEPRAKTATCAGQARIDHGVEFCRLVTSESTLTLPACGTEDTQLHYDGRRFRCVSSFLSASNSTV